MITADELLRRGARRQETIKIDAGDLSEDIAICELSIDDRTNFGEYSEGSYGRRLAYIVSRGCPILADFTPDQILNALSSSVIESIATEVMRISGMLDEGDDEEKKEGGTATGGLSTGSL